MNNKSFSFLIASRNDDYEGKPIERLRLSVKHNYEILKRYNIDFEILICDWGSEITKKIQDVLDLEEIDVKCFYVPQEICNKFDTPFSEVHALNLLFRKAEKNFVARLDQDIMLGERFVKWIADTENLDEVLHWSVRRDMNNMNHILIDEHTMPWDNSWSNGAGSYSSFFGAVGILMYPTIKMKKLRGYNEKNIYRNHMEHELLKRLVANDNEKFVDLGILLDRPFYHIPHSRSDGEKRKANNFVNGEFTNICENDENWGLFEFDNVIKIYNCIR